MALSDKFPSGDGSSVAAFIPSLQSTFDQVQELLTNAVRDVAGMADMSPTLAHNLEKGGLTLEKIEACQTIITAYTERQSPPSLTDYHHLISTVGIIGSAYTNAYMEALIATDPIRAKTRKADETDPLTFEEQTQLIAFEKYDEMKGMANEAERNLLFFQSMLALAAPTPSRDASP